MTLSIYDISVAVYLPYLANLKTMLTQAIQYAEERNFDSDILLSSRLRPDMFPLARQVQIATDMAKGCAARLAGDTPPSYDDNERSLHALIERLDTTAKFLQSYGPEAINGSENRTIELKLRQRELTFTGTDYVINFVSPNFFFHVSTAYAILRHQGVPLSKADFLGG